MRFLYNTAFGRVILRAVKSRPVSAAAGAYMNSRLSKPLIKRFIKKNGIDMSEYQDEEYRCFNDFFTRRIRPEKRPVDQSPGVLVSPCDGNLSVFRITGGTVLPIKQCLYTVSDLLSGDPIAEKYVNGYCLVFRLTVKNYHRYTYLDSGKKGENVHIKGVFHTVRPIALRRYPVFVQNTREYTVIETENFGTVTQVEVGAALVGRIKNHDGAKTVVRGGEKGMFLFGGSTIVVLIEANKAKIDEDLEKITADGGEAPVLMGEKIGERL